MVSFDGMEAVLNTSFYHDPENLLANSKRKLKMNSHVIGGIMTGEKKEGFSHPIVYTLENIEVCVGIAPLIPPSPIIINSPVDKT